MKKSKLCLGLVAGLASVAALASCSEVKPVASSEGYVLTYKSSSGETIHYTAEELFGSYFDESSQISSMFDKVYALIIRNYFKVETAGINKYADIKKNAENDVEGVKSTANKNAESNSTSYSEEFDKLLESYSCEDESELLEHFIYEREKTEFEKQFYDDKTLWDKTGVEYLRDATLASNGYEGYIEKKVPYHVRHILVKFNGTSSNKDFWNDTIDEKDAKNLFTVASSLAKGDLDFGQIAKNSSEFSDGSAANYGELDIVDKDTDYVNEFKLGIYAYENLYGENQEAANKSEISIVKQPINRGTPNAKYPYADINGDKGLDIAKGYKDAVNYDSTGGYDMRGDEYGEIATIPYGAFVAMDKWAKTTNTSIGEVVNEGKNEFYPRNVIYNKYLNRHNVAFITPNEIPANIANTSSTQELVDENTVGYAANAQAGITDYSALAGFKNVIVGYDDQEQPITKKVLCTTDGKPILVVRAGTSEYQGVHFMVVERSPFETKVGAASLSEYYSVKYPGQTGYISDKQTYVNFLNQGTKEIKARAEKVSSKIKGFDSNNLNKLIYTSYKSEMKLSFNTFKVGEVEYDLGKAIDKWIAVTKNKSEFDAANTWEEKWESYLNSLEQQKAERRKLVSEVCAIGFTTSNSSKEAALWGEGGACYVPTQK